MVFSSIQAYLDPSNWQQQQQNTSIIGSTSTNPLLPPPHQPPPPTQPTHGGGSIRPGSMSERARVANIPLPEAALKCPRCESTNTKFCYFNNYSLSQPRHFCKTCRRYWTRGGALRNVPVGGGYRRNKRSKSSANSKSPASGNTATTSSTSNMSASSGGLGNNNNNNTAANILGLGPQLPPLRFMSPLGQQLTYGFAADVGLNYSGIISSSPMMGSSADNQNINNFHGSSGNNLFGHGCMPSLFPSSGIIEPWRLHHQYPNFLGGGGGLEAAQGVYNQFQGGGIGHLDSSGGFLGGEGSPGGGGGGGGHHLRPKLVFSSGSSSVMSQVTSIKMEDNNNINHEMNFSRQLLGGISSTGAATIEQWSNGGGNNNAWSDHQPSGFRSSSPSDPL